MPKAAMPTNRCINTARLGKRLLRHAAGFGTSRNPTYHVFSACKSAAKRFTSAAISLATAAVEPIVKVISGVTYALNTPIIGPSQMQVELRQLQQQLFDMCQQQHAITLTSAPVPASLSTSMAMSNDAKALYVQLINRITTLEAEVATLKKSSTQASAQQQQQPQQLRSVVPQQAVVHRRPVESVVIPAPQPQPQPINSNTTSSSESYTKYHKMLSVGIPSEAVLQKVRADGLSTPGFRTEAHLPQATHTVVPNNNNNTAAVISSQSIPTTATTTTNMPTSPDGIFKPAAMRPKFNGQDFLAVKLRKTNTTGDNTKQPPRAPVQASKPMNHADFIKTALLAKFGKTAVCYSPTSPA